MRIETTSADETERAGAALAARLAPGDVVLVRGDLGAGKTAFVRGAARALGVTAPVTSPTFTIGQLYGGTGADVAHLDFYRLSSLPPEDADIVTDYATPERIAFVEWPDVAAPALERVAASVKIEHAGGDRRIISVT